VVHDARLYTVQALRALIPDRLNSDIYLKYGSQDSFTLFSWFYRPLLAVFGISTGHAIAALLGQALWGAGLLLFLSRLFNDVRTLIGALVAVLLLSSAYGASGIFNYAETFATPRIYAEGLILAALGCALRGRWLASLALIALSSTLHPIMALTGFGLIFLYSALSRPVLWLAGAGVALFLVALTLSHVGPFGRLAQSYDPKWFSIVRGSTPYLFMTGWRGEDILGLSARFGFCVAAFTIANSQERKGLLAVLALTSLGLATTFVGADLLRNLLVVQVQPWRTYWLLTLTANISAALLILRLPRQFVSREVIIVSAALSALGNFCDVWLTPEIVALVGFVALGAELTMRRRLPMPAVVVLRTWCALAFCVAAVLTVIIAVLPDFWQSILRATLAAGVLAVICRPKLLGPKPSLIVAGVALVVATAIWDERSEWEKFIENPRVQPELAAFSPPSKHLYWEQGLELQWLKLREPGYYSCLQRVGTMLSRDNAIDFDRRTQALRNLNTQDFGKVEGDICPMKAQREIDGPSNVAALQATCAALPDLDGVILMRPVPGGHAMTWNAPAPLLQMLKGKASRITHFYRYSCDSRPSATQGLPASS
jgi:hypothetical protein